MERYDLVVIGSGPAGEKGAAQLLRELMEEAGLETPPAGRTLESICIVEVCSPDYDPVEYN